MDTQQQWESRIVGHGEEEPEQLCANPLNWKIHTAAQQDVVGGLLDGIGWIDEVTVNRRTGFVVNGHLRVLLAMRTGQRRVPVRYVDLDEAEEALALATLDSSTGLAGSDPQQLQAVVEAAQAAAPDAGPVAGFLDDLLTEAGALEAAQLGGSSGGRAIGRSGEATVKVVLTLPQADVFERALAATGERNRASALLLICTHFLTTYAERQYDPGAEGGAAPEPLAAAD